MNNLTLQIRIVTRFKKLVLFISLPLSPLFCQNVLAHSTSTDDSQFILSKTDPTKTTDDNIEQSANKPTTNLMVITARKRTEYVNDVPIAISVFDTEMINNMTMQRADDITNMVPNLQWKAAGGAGSNISIRGISDNSFHLNQVGAVGIYADEVSLNSSIVSLFPLFDVARIEVLRGPQNTLYGRNTTGGAINYIFRKPILDKDFSGLRKLSLGNYQSFKLETALNVPLDENIAARISLTSHQRDGIVENPITQENESDIQRNAIRLQLLLLAKNDMELLLSYHQGIDRGQSRRYKSIGLFDPVTEAVCQNSYSVGNGCSDLFGFADTANFAEVFANVPSPKQDIDSAGSSLHFIWNLNEDLTLTSISALENNDFLRTEDADAGPFDIFEFHQLSEAKQISQEVRLGLNKDDWSWITGLYYFSEKLDASSATLLRFVPAFPGGVGGATIAEQKNTVWSTYSQFDFSLAINWGVTFGLRYTQESKQGINQAFRHNAGGIVSVGDFAFPDVIRQSAFVTFEPAVFDKQWNDWGGHIGLQYTTESNDLLYTSVARGFKAGGINLGPQQAFIGFAGSTVDPEYLTTYELGAKTNWLENKLQLNLAVFYNDYSNQQISQVVSTEFGPGPLQTNAGKSVTKGFELDLRWLPQADLLLTISLGALDAKFVEFNDGQGGSYAGNNLVQSPRLNLSGLLQKYWSIDQARLLTQLSVSHLEKQDFSVTNDVRLREDAYTVFDGRASYLFGKNEQYELAFWIKNITDKKYCTERIDLIDFGVVQCLPSEPKTFGLTGSLYF